MRWCYICRRGTRFSCLYLCPSFLSNSFISSSSDFLYINGFLCGMLVVLCFAYVYRGFSSIYPPPLPQYLRDLSVIIKIFS